MKIAVIERQLRTKRPALTKVLSELKAQQRVSVVGVKSGARWQLCTRVQPGERLTDARRRLDDADRYESVSVGKGSLTDTVQQLRARAGHAS